MRPLQSRRAATRQPIALPGAIDQPDQADGALDRTFTVSPWASDAKRRKLESIRAVVGQRAGVLLVTGDAGCGKTVFAGEIAAVLRADGCTVVPCDRSSAGVGRRIDQEAASLPADGAGLVVVWDDADLACSRALRELSQRLRRMSDAAGLRVILIGGQGLRQR